VSAIQTVCLLAFKCRRSTGIKNYSGMLFTTGMRSCCPPNLIVPQPGVLNGAD
jgi:hypothetical protein